MAEVSGKGSAGFAVERKLGEASSNAQASTPLTVSASFKEGSSKGSSRRRASVRPSLDADEFINLLHGSDPVKLELNRLENEVRDKDRELGEANSQIKALKLSERLREKAVEEALRSKYPQFAQLHNGIYMQQDAEECWTQLLFTLSLALRSSGSRPNCANCSVTLFLFCCSVELVFIV